MHTRLRHLAHGRHRVTSDVVQSDPVHRSYLWMALVSSSSLKKFKIAEEESVTHAGQLCSLPPSPTCVKKCFLVLLARTGANVQAPCSLEKPRGRLFRYIGITQSDAAHSHREALTLVYLCVSTPAPCRPRTRESFHCAIPDLSILTHCCKLTRFPADASRRTLKAKG